MFWEIDVEEVRRRVHEKVRELVLEAYAKYGKDLAEVFYYVDGRIEELIKNLNDNIMVAAAFGDEVVEVPEIQYDIRRCSWNFRLLMSAIAAAAWRRVAYQAINDYMPEEYISQ